MAAPAALACSGGPSAVNVYKECLSNGGSGGGGHKGGGGSGGSSNSTSTGGSQSGNSGTSAPPAVSAKAKKALAHMGSTDKSTLQQLYRNAGGTRFLSSSHAPTSEPTALGSAFDLGSGPTALLIVLAGTAVVLLAGTGLRGWRRSHPTE